MGTTVGATNDGTSSCSDFPNLNHDVWYTYTPASDGMVAVDACDTPQTVNSDSSVTSGRGAFSPSDVFMVVVYEK